MIRDIMMDETFLSQKAEPATPNDLPVAQDRVECRGTSGESPGH